MHIGIQKRDKSRGERQYAADGEHNALGQPVHAVVRDARPIIPRVTTPRDERRSIRSGERARDRDTQTERNKREEREREERGEKDKKKVRVYRSNIS